MIKPTKTAKTERATEILKKALDTKTLGTAAGARGCPACSQVLSLERSDIL